MNNRNHLAPQAVPILYSKEDGRIHVDTENLARVLRQPELQDKPVCIVSISGAFRKGKSFMLNFFLRYLHKRGFENPEWMGGGDLELNEGFSWRGGRDACTNGILLWSEVFTVIKAGKEVAILLMDTQGLFDNRTDSKANTLIFALSTLLSSIQIFNLTQQIQESDLGFLQFFTAYAQAARTDSAISKDEKPFQSLVFLVRDWPYAEELAYGLDGGQEHLSQVLQCDTSSSELMEVRKHLKSSFEETKCCLMPYPGQKVAATKAFNGQLKDIDPTFLRHLDGFVSSLFRPENLVMKKINGSEVTAMTILQYAFDCGEGLTDGKLPTPRTMMEHAAEAQNFETQKFCSDMYITAMRKALGDSFLEDAALSAEHERSSAAARKEFYDRTRFGSEKSRKKHLDYLEYTIERELKMLNTINYSRRVEAESKMLKLVEKLATHYENGMKTVTDCTASVPEDDLEIQNNKLVTEVLEKFYADDTACDKLKDAYNEKLQERLDRTYGRIERENRKKRQVEEEQSKLEKNLLRYELECSMQYRQEMRKEVAEYKEEASLLNAHEAMVQTVLNELDRKIRELKISTDHATFRKRREICAKYLEEEFEVVQFINEEKRKTLAKTLESLRSRMYVEYDQYFSELLKDSYMEPNDLHEKHNELAEKLMIAARASVETRASNDPLCVEHLELTQQALDEKYQNVYKWNEKNNTFFRKCMRFVKSIVDHPLTKSLLQSLKKFVLHQAIPM